jgi:hypothetical protein
MSSITSTPELPKPPLAPPVLDMRHYDPNARDIAFWKLALGTDSEEVIKERVWRAAEE